MNVFISSAIDNERLPLNPNAEDIVFGKAHYSWKIIARMYEEAIEGIDQPVRKIKAPDIYQSVEARDILGINSHDAHIAVKPIEHIRPMFGVRNFFVVGWEFPEFSDRALDDNPKNNQVAILKRAEKVLCWSSFTANNLLKYGVRNAVALPPPVVGLTDLISASVDGLQCVHCAENDPEDIQFSIIHDVRANYETVFFTVLNPFDKRKRFPQLVQAFNEFSAGLNKEKPAALVIKLVIDNIHTTAPNIFEILRIHYDVNEVSQHIYFIGDVVRPAEMMGMYNIFDFYYCPSSAEGLNLPLIEAMASGMVPISSSATAMGDYVDIDNAVVLKTSRTVAGPGISALGDAIEISHFPSMHEELVRGFFAATSLAPETRRTMAENAKKTVNSRYGLERFLNDFQRTVLEA